MDRRNFMRLGCVALTSGSVLALAKNFQAMEMDLSALERETGGRLGVFISDQASGKSFGYRQSERFPMCSTFKWLAGAALLKRVDSGQESLDRRVHFSTERLMEWAPVTRRFAGNSGMTLAELCEAAITESDNTAADIIVQEIGGIPAWNAYVRSLGDDTTRLDRPEPFLNEARAGDERDTTTPAAMSRNLRRILLENALSTSSRDLLLKWMYATKYSGQRLRKNLPEDWRLADKTGTGNSGTGTASDVGVFWSPRGDAVVVSVYLTQARVDRAQQETAIATIGRWMREGWRG